MTIYQELKAAGIPLDNHESDLYAKQTPESLKILAKYPTNKSNAKTFINQHNSEIWMDIPFAFDPFWENRSRT